MKVNARALVKHRVVLKETSNFEYDFVYYNQFEEISISELNNFLNEIERDKTRKKLGHRIYEVSCSLIDVYLWIKQFNLTKVFDYNSVEKCTYSDTRHAFPLQKNSYIVCKNSLFGGYCFNLNIDSVYIGATIDFKNQRYKNSCNIVKQKNIKLSQLVILDIETTGLSFFDDDIIEIALYDIESGKSFCRKLPLRKKDTIPENISKINHITNDMILDSKSLTQKDITNLINEFKLCEKYLAIWSGSNQFDAIFLNIYFIDNSLNGFDELSFFNIRSFIKDKGLFASDNFSKDYVANCLGIRLNESHSALGDCKIEAEIIRKLFENNYD